MSTIGAVVENGGTGKTYAGSMRKLLWVPKELLLVPSSTPALTSQVPVKGSVTGPGTWILNLAFYKDIVRTRGAGDEAVQNAVNGPVSAAHDDERGSALRADAACNRGSLVQVSGQVQAVAYSR